MCLFMMRNRGCHSYRATWRSLQRLLFRYAIILVKPFQLKIGNPWIPFVGRQSSLGFSDLIDNNNVIMGALASQITSVSFVHSIVCSGADQRKHQSFASLALWEVFTGDRCIPCTQRASNAENVSIWRRHHVLERGHQVSSLNCGQRLITFCVKVMKHGVCATYDIHPKGILNSNLTKFLCPNLISRLSDSFEIFHSAWQY